MLDIWKIQKGLGFTEGEGVVCKTKKFKESKEKV